MVKTTMTHCKNSTSIQTGKPKTKQRQITFQMYNSTIFSEVISKHGVKPDAQKLKALMEMPAQK